MKKLINAIFVFAILAANAQISHSSVAQIVPQGPSQISYSFETQTTDFQTTTEGAYQIVKTDQSRSYTSLVGSPQLPVFTKKLVLPAGSIVTNVLINNQNEELIDSNILLYPTQPPGNWVSSSSFVAPDQSVYNSSAAYPASTGVKIADEVSQGYHLVTLEICPFKYIPVQKRLSLYRTINITVKYTVGSIEYQEKITKFRSNLNKEWVASNVANPQLLNSIAVTAKNVLDTPTETDKIVLHWKPSKYGDVPDYIIITNETLKPYFKVLKDYKTKRGLPTLLVTTEQIYANYSGVDNAEKIRNYLKAAHYYWGAGLFVLLAGDTDVIPARIGYYDFEGQSKEEKMSTDLYYSDVYKPNTTNYNWNANGNSRFGESINYGNVDGVEMGMENYIGRAPINNAEESQNFIQKIITYENLTGVSDKSYVKNMLFLGSYLHHINAGEATSVGGQPWHDYLGNRPFLFNNSALKIWKLYDDYLGNAVNTFIGNEELDKVNTIDRMNNGKSGIGKFHLVSHFDHGGPFGIGVSGEMWKRRSN